MHVLAILNDGGVAERTYSGTYTMRLELDQMDGEIYFACWDGAMPPHVAERYETYEDWKMANPVEAAAENWERQE